MNRYLFFLLFILSNAVCFSQQNIYAFKNFSEKDGLASKSVYSIDQDELGFIWVGTSNGLYRYDGHQFKYFKSPLDGNERRINSILVTVKYDKSLNRLWLASISDLQYFDLNTYEFHNLVNNDLSLKKLFSSDIKTIFLKDKLHLLIGVRNEIYSYDIQAKKFEAIYGKYNFEADTKKSFVRFEQPCPDTTFVIFPNYVYLLSKEDKILNKYKAVNNEIFQNIYFDRVNKIIWMAATRCLIKIDLNNGKLERKYFKYQTNKGITLNHFISELSPQDGNHLFLSGMGGMMVYNIRTGQNAIIPYSKGENENQMSGIIHFTDNQGNFWRGSFNDYCNVLFHQSTHIKKFQTNNDKTGINIEPFKTVYGGEQKFYFNGSGTSGFGEIDLTNNSVKFFEKDKVVNSITNDLIYIKQKKIIICNQSDIFIYNIATNLFDKLAEKPFKNTEYLFQWTDEILAFTSNLYVFNYNLKTKEIIKMSPSDAEESSNIQNSPFKPELVYKGHLYFSSKEGIYYQEKPFSRLKKLILPAAKNTGKKVNNIKKMLVDSFYQFWIATENNGLFVYNTNKNEIINISTENSIMKNDLISDLSLDKNNRLWAAALDKYYLFDIVNYRCLTSYGNNIGLESIGYDFNIHENNIATFNNYAYINFLDLNKISELNSTSPPVITSVIIGSKSMTSIPITGDTSFKCKYDESVISFAYTNLSLNNSESNQYKIKLEGLDTSWTTTTNREITYARLPSGHYTFLLQASNSNGNWHPQTLKIKVTVAPPFYFSWWFLLLAIFLMCAVVFYFYDQKIKKIRSEEQLKRKYEKQISEVEMKALRAQMNPHFIFNSLNSIQKYIFEKDEYAASQYLTKFSRLIRLILDHSNQDYINVASEVELLKYYIEMERLRFSNKFDFDLVKDFDVKEEWLIPSMVIQPHVENAIWHGLMHKDENCKLKIQFAMINDNSLLVIIEDNGIGREKAQNMKSKQVLKNKSFGSNISKERINHFNQLHDSSSSFEIIDLKDNEGRSTGTRVQLSFPIVKANQS